MKIRSAPARAISFVPFVIYLFFKSLCRLSWVGLKILTIVIVMSEARTLNLWIITALRFFFLTNCAIAHLHFVICWIGYPCRSVFPHFQVTVWLVQGDSLASILSHGIFLSFSSHWLWCWRENGIYVMCFGQDIDRWDSRKALCFNNYNVR